MRWMTWRSTSVRPYAEGRSGWGGGAAVAGGAGSTVAGSIAAGALAATRDAKDMKRRRE